MKTFEEKWTAWIDDQLTGEELAAFEASLPDKAAAETEKRAARKLGTLLNRELKMQELPNADFFSHQLREAIARDEQENSRSHSGGGSSFWWPIRRLAWAGAASLAIFVAIAVFVMQEQPQSEPSDYLTKIREAKLDPANGPNATVSIFDSEDDQRVTVLWTEGLKSLPAEYAAK